MADTDDRTGYTTARVIVRTAPTELLTLAKGRAPDPSIFDDHPPFMWLNEISSDRLDAYYTVMDPLTTLVNYAADAAIGVAVLIGHETRSLPIGHSLTGTLEHVGDVTRVTSDAYALTDDTSASAINRLRAGIVRDISVGFSYRGAQCICSICQRDMYRDWKCWHIPGVSYKRTDNVDDTMTDPNGALCTGLITNAHLSEYSLVYDGATPGAAVLQAQRNAEAGRLTIDQARLIEQRYRINLPGKRLVIQGGSMGAEANGNGGTALPDERELQQILERAGVPSDKTGLDRIRWLADEVKRLAPLALDGQTYRTDLVATGVAEAVRAFGAEKGEQKRKQLETADLETIKEMTASWREIGDSKLTGGRSTTDESGAGDPQPQTFKKVQLGGLSRS